MRTPLFISLFFILLVHTACRNKNTIPPNILKQEKMKAVIWDMIRADQFLANFVFSRDSAVNKVAESYRLYDKIFLIHKVTEEEFRRSYNYYSTRPELMKKLMDSIVVNRTVAQESISSETLIESTTDTAAIKPQPANPDTLKNKKGIRNLQIN